MDSPQLLKIDCLTLSQHTRLSETDECYYLLEYTSGERYDSSRGNQLIHNFKKSVDKIGTSQWPYKGQAIREVAALMCANIPTIVDPKSATFVPIPTSKAKTNVLYDDRLVKTLTLCNAHCNLDVKEALITHTDRDAFHETQNRSYETLDQTIDVDSDIIPHLRETVVLFDDVITAGTHFVCCRDKILAMCPEKRIIGLFIARRIPQDPFAALQRLGFTFEPLL